MKKTLIFLCLFFSLLQFSYSEETFSNMDEPKSEYIISPFIGFGAVGVTTGFDFMYRHRSGFSTLANLNLSVPISGMGGILGQTELFLGYSIKRNRFYVGFSAGFWGGGGVSFQGYELSYAGNPEGEVSLEYYQAMLLLFTIRNDYTYFFTERIGITASHSYGAGLHAGPWLTHDFLMIFSFMAKVGVAFKI